MSLEQTAELYASILRQLLPDGVYDTAEMTHVADDIYAHAKALAQADIDAHRLLRVLETIPVDLLADYEREYGLPMQCMMPGSQTIEERISVLRWIRQHRNVMNREYLEQILAIFGVTLVDVVKHYPMQCMAPCNSPVNTERLRYKVLLRLQYPMTADMSCIIENYLPGYLRVEWVVDMPWGEWILNAGYELSGDNIRYTAHKTNQRNYYDSFANFDLITALVRSFYDIDMQQWQAIKDAANQLTGVTNWFFDLANNSISYDIKPKDEYLSQYIYAYFSGYPSCSTKNSFNLAEIAAYAAQCYGQYYLGNPNLPYRVSDWNNNRASVYIMRDGVEWPYSIYRSDNPSYNPNIQAERRSVPLLNAAQKILTNTLSTDQGMSLLAEAYCDNVAKSLFNMDPAKQFVKLSDLLSQFDLNKTLRT